MLSTTVGHFRREAGKGAIREMEDRKAAASALSEGPVPGLSTPTTHKLQRFLSVTAVIAPARAPGESSRAPSPVMSPSWSSG